MKRHLYLLPLLIIFLFGRLVGSATSKPLKPKYASLVDFTTQGILFGSRAEVKRDLGATKARITYFIRRKDKTGKAEKLGDKLGLFVYALEPGEYEIYDWALSGLADADG